MKVLLTGCAGFIGAKVTEMLLKDNISVIGVDNLNDYYDTTEEMNEKIRAILEEKLIEVYKMKKITFDNKSLYNKNNKFKEKEEMPILEDLYNVLCKDEKNENLKIKLKPFINGSMSYYNHHTTVEINNKLIIN